jgi:hypothetical protein
MMPSGDLPCKWLLKCRAVADNLEEAGDRLFTFMARRWRVGDVE